METDQYKKIIVGLLLLTAGVDVYTTETVQTMLDSVEESVEPPEPQRIDDWQFQRSEAEDDGPTLAEKMHHVSGQTIFSLLAGVPFAGPGTFLLSGGGLVLGAQAWFSQIMSNAQSTAAMESASGDLGYTTGGAKDIQNFRDNIDAGYLPSPTDITYQGLYYQYYLDRGQQDECNELFCPSYSQAVSEDPLSDEEEQFMTVGLNSNLALDEFERKKLNMVLVLDISGSMGSGFDQYYYDRFGNRHEVNNTGKSKMTVAAESLAALTEHLREDDRLGVVLFNSRAHKAKPLRLTNETDMEAIRDHMLELRAGGGTNMDAGIQMATDMIDDYADSDQTEYENRIVFLTDAMPNIGRYGEDELFSMTESNAQNNIHTTFVGMGVDFNTELVEEITAIRGANYFSVHSSDQFKERMDENFKYMVTPLVFDLEMTLESEAYSIDRVYGSTAADESTGELMQVNTLFPSPTDGDSTRGGVVLLRLDKDETAPSDELSLTVEYEDRTGEQEQSTRTITFGDHDPEYFENDGIRKAIVLTRYVDLMKNWVIYEKEQYSDDVPDEAYERAQEPGVEPPRDDLLNQWEQQSTPLSVSEEYETKISEFKDHFETEMETLGDDSMSQEVELMESLVSE